MFFKKRRKTHESFFRRAFRSTFAIIVLTAFVLGISLFVKELSSLALNSSKFAHLSAPLLSQVGLTQEDAGQVAGEFVERFSQTGLVKEDTPTIKNGEKSGKNGADRVPELFTVALLADSGEDTEHLLAALQKAKDLEVDFIIHLGDLTAWGDVKSLENIKNILDDSGMTWYVLPGDHDLAQSVGTQNFLKVFDTNYTTIEIKGVKILLLDNSANYTPLDETRFNWYSTNIIDTDFLMLSQPLYHPSNDRIMGIVNGEIQDSVYDQAKIILDKVQESDTKAIFAADRHMSSKSADEKNSNLNHYVVGALAKSRSYQTPRFSILTVFEDLTYDVSEIVL